ESNGQKEIRVPDHDARVTLHDGRTDVHLDDCLLPVAHREQAEHYRGDQKTPTGQVPLDEARQAFGKYLHGDVRVLLFGEGQGHEGRDHHVVVRDDGDGAGNRRVENEPADNVQGDMDHHQGDCEATDDGCHIGDF